MERQFRKILYATKQRVDSATKFLIFDDRGTLQLNAGSLRFSGKKNVIDIDDVVEADLVSQRINWVTYLIVNVVLIVYLAFIGIGLGPALVLLVISNAVGILIGKSTKWVLVRYRDHSGQLREAYFADATALGWGGLLGGTRKLCEAIKEDRPAARSASSSV